MDKEDVLFLIKLTSTVLFAFFILFFGGNAIQKQQIRESCNSFNKTSGWETKYVEYTYISVDCLAKQDNGKWVSAYNLRGIDNN